MAKQRHLKIPIPKWTWWQTTKALVSIIIAFRIELNNEIIQLLKEFISVCP